MLIYLGLRNEEGDRIAAKPEVDENNQPATALPLLEAGPAEQPKRPPPTRKSSGRVNNTRQRRS
jgi:hypothetical protein